jgi:hypothetical protein
MGDVVMDDGDLLLELLNSTPLVAGRPTDELSGTAAIGWLRARGIPATPQEARALREAVAAVVRAEAPAAVLQPFLAGVAQVPSVDGAGVHWRLADAGFAARAVLAWAELDNRLRPCENPECRLFLVDRSRANTRRWCSMAACGNRLKARRHQQRRVAANGRPGDRRLVTEATTGAGRPASQLTRQGTAPNVMEQ